MNFDYAKFVCLGTTLSTCYKEQPISQVACGRAVANRAITVSEHSQLPPFAKSFVVVQGDYTEKEEVVAGHYTEEILADQPIVVVCGTPLRQN